MTYIEMDEEGFSVYSYRNSLICRICQALGPSDVVLMTAYRMSWRVKFVGTGHTFYNIDGVEWKGEPGMSPILERE